MEAKRREWRPEAQIWCLHMDWRVCFSIFSILLEKIRKMKSENVHWLHSTESVECEEMKTPRTVRFLKTQQFVSLLDEEFLY